MGRDKSLAGYKRVARALGELQAVRALAGRQGDPT